MPKVGTLYPKNPAHAIIIDMGIKNRKIGWLFVWGGVLSLALLAYMSFVVIPQLSSLFIDLEVESFNITRVWAYIFTGLAVTLCYMVFGFLVIKQKISAISNFTAIVLTTVWFVILSVIFRFLALSLVLPLYSLVGAI